MTRHCALRFSAVLAVALVIAATAKAAELSLPVRPARAETGSEFARRITGLSLAEREVEIERAILQGNVPDWWRRLQPVRLSISQGGSNRVVTLFVTPDYLSLGSDDDWLHIPLAPLTAQNIADRLDCLLPTPRIVDAIYRSAAVHLEPQPIPPGPEMTTVPVFEKHSTQVREQLGSRRGILVAGHKKDVVISNRLTDAPGKVAIYGWHRTNGQPIQPLYLGHGQSWVDYSHGIRLISDQVLIDGETNSLRRVWNDPDLAAGLSDEGILRITRYQRSVAGDAGSKPVSQKPSAFRPRPGDAETLSEIEVGPGVRAFLSQPSVVSREQPVRLVLYALPNGSSIEQSMGKRMEPSDDWRFDIQHVAAQTRFVRDTDPGNSWVVIYLEAEGRAWPAWRKKYSDNSRRIIEIVGRCRQRWRDSPVELVLAGHSGGGSFLFGYLNGVPEIPDHVTRLAFLDANYAYDPSLGHGRKLLNWLKASTNHFLTVFAYDDASALLDGKPFVTPTGGTWGKSQRMLSDFNSALQFERVDADGMQRHWALNGRLQFFLKENPEKKILHTVQVERNGFIHALLSGTALDQRGYRYYGERVYEKWIR